MHILSGQYSFVCVSFIIRWNTAAVSNKFTNSSVYEKNKSVLINTE